MRAQGSETCGFGGVWELVFCHSRMHVHAQWGKTGGLTLMSSGLSRLIVKLSGEANMLQ